MSKSEQIYVSIDPLEYKRNKAILLSSQLDILDSIKHLQTIKRLRADKTKFKARLRELSSSINKDLESLQSKLPQVKKPKTKKEDNQDNSEKQINLAEKIDLVERDKKQKDIELELRDIREKLRRLNS